MLINYLWRKTPTMRFRNKFIFFKNKFFKNPKLFKVVKSLAGRNNTGRLCIYTKQYRPALRVPSFRIVWPFKVLNIFLKWNEISNFTNKRYSVYECSGGYSFVLPKVYGNTVGTFYRFKTFKIRKLVEYNRLREINLGLPCFVKCIPFFYNICNLFLPHHVRGVYAVSSGTSCVKIPTDKRNKMLKIILPSDLEFFFNPKVLCIVGKNPFFEKKLYKPGKAGVSFFYGKKPIVRGVAMNPVDHPNGGRTKSCSPELSPWGWVTKKSH